LLSISEKTANYYAQIYKNLRNKGKPIPTNDMWIAATILEYSLDLYSNDNHFDEIDSIIRIK